MRKIPKKIYQLYTGFNYKIRIYVKLRWKLCPFELISDFLPLEGVIVDTGCGYGLLANYLSFQSSVRHVIGIDNSLDRLAIAQATINQRKNIKFIQKDIKDLNLDQCQAVVMSDFLHHLPIKVSRDLLNKVFNRLTSGGKLVIQEVDKKPYWKYLITLIIDRLLNPFQKLNYQSVKYWQDILESIGFHVEIKPAHKGLPLADVILICKKQ